MRQQSGGESIEAPSIAVDLRLSSFVFTNSYKWMERMVN